MKTVNVNVTHTFVLPKGFPCCEAKGEPVPRPHQVGDRVTLTGPNALAVGRATTLKPGTMYTVKKEKDDEGDIKVADDGGYLRYVAASSMTRVPTEPVPDGPAEGMRRVTIDVNALTRPEHWRRRADQQDEIHNDITAAALRAIADAVEAQG